jgi:hypothetical protein
MFERNVIETTKEDDNRDGEGGQQSTQLKEDGKLA